MNYKREESPGLNVIWNKNNTSVISIPQSSNPATLFAVLPTVTQCSQVYFLSITWILINLATLNFQSSFGVQLLVVVDKFLEVH